MPFKTILLGPTLSYALGAASNIVTIAFNKGQMPVLWPGGCSDMTPDADMQIHVCMTTASHLKPLADWIVVSGLGVLSPGDLLIFGALYSFVPALLIWIALVIQDANK